MSLPVYTAKILSIIKQPADVLSILEVTVQYFKDGILLDPPNLKPIRTTNSDDINRFISQQIQTFQKQDAIDNFAANPPIGDVDLTPKLPSQAEIDRDIFLKNINKLQQIKKVIALGIVGFTDQDVLDLTSTLSSTFKIEYLNII